VELCIDGRITISSLSALNIGGSRRAQTSAIKEMVDRAMKGICLDQRAGNHVQGPQWDRRGHNELDTHQFGLARCAFAIWRHQRKSRSRAISTTWSPDKTELTNGGCGEV
jgi:hypothetical protein